MKQVKMVIDTNKGFIRVKSNGTTIRQQITEKTVTTGLLNKAIILAELISK